MRVTKELIFEIINENHLYKSNGESITKTMLWIISWICGVRSTMNSTDKRAIASALLLFAVTLLMEFGLNVMRKTHIVSRLIDLLFCISGMVIIGFAVSCLVITDEHFDEYFRVMYIITICQMIFIGVDFMVFWVLAGIKSGISENIKAASASAKELQCQSDDSARAQFNDFNDRQKLNDQHYNGGNLGNTSEGENNE